MSTRKFNPSGHEKLLSEDREKTTPVTAIFSQLPPLAGLTVLDIGCGNGYFAIPFAREVGAGGFVYAIDTSQEMLELLAGASRELNNIKMVLSEESSIPLADTMGDLIFSSIVYHEFEDRPAMIKELVRLAKPDASHVVIDWNQRSDEHGPRMGHRVAEEVVVAEYELAGLGLKKRFQPGPDHYGLIFSKS
ncbi:MAG: class I SAM-dependent methyltransferase [Candidatus Marinimicrobia bacterium]|nr:class I SAM-dependent methyltransferase [Candidatus Neomarinimicrobiota bacterium]